MSHNYIADCCVVGVYDSSQATELPRAYIVLQPWIENNTETINLISKFVEDSVISYKKLRGGIRVIKQVPKSASGKILRREIKAWIKKEQEVESIKARL